MQEFNVKIDKGFMMSLYDVFANLMSAEESEVNFPNTPPSVSLFCQIKFLYYVMTLKINKRFMMSLYDVFANRPQGSWGIWGKLTQHSNTPPPS